MRHFDDWVTDPELRLDALRAFTTDRSRIAEPFLGRYVVWESSGSSGEPGIFVQDATAMAVYDALEALRRPELRPLRRLLDPWCLGERIVCAFWARRPIACVLLRRAGTAPRQPPFLTPINRR